jgi:hypothetical protein
MFASILAEMREAARVGRVYLTEYARGETANDGLTFEDIVHCILTGEIVEQ